MSWWQWVASSWRPCTLGGYFVISVPIHPKVSSHFFFSKILEIDTPISHREVKVYLYFLFNFFSSERVMIMYHRCTKWIIVLHWTRAIHLDPLYSTSVVAVIYVSSCFIALGWRHNDHAGVSNHQPHGCLLNRLFRRKSKKTSKLRVTGLCAGNSPGTGEFLAQMASYAENVSIWWRHHGISL